MPAVTDRVREILQRGRSRVESLGNAYEQGGWRTHHRDLSDYLLNRRGKFLEKKDYDPNDGAKVNKKINNSVPEEAVHTAAAGLMGGFTSPSVPWVQIIPQDEDLRDFKPAREWLWRQQSTMYEILETSNWYLTLPQVYEELVAFGTAPMRLDLHMVRTLHCIQHTAGSYYLSNGSDGTVDTVAYRFPRTVRDLVSIYGVDGVSRKTRESYEKRVPELDRWVKCVNLVERNEGRDRRFKDWRGMQYRSMTYEEDASEDEPPLKMRGNKIFPVVVPRTGRRAEEVYGSSRGMRALPDARQLQSEERRSSEALAKKLNPPMALPSSMRRLDLRQGGQNRYRGQRADAIRPLFDVRFPYAEVRDTIGRRESHIEDVLGASTFKQFQALDATGNHNMTVPEVQERRSEKMAMLGPTQQSVHQDLLQPAIQVIWSYMSELGKLEDAPPELSEMPLKIQFTSQLALEQRSTITSAMQALGSMIAEMEAAGYAGARDKFDFDVAIDEISQGFLVPPKVLRDEGAVEQIRQQRLALQQQQAQLDQEQSESQTVRNLGGASVGDGTALDALAGGGGAG